MSQIINPDRRDDSYPEHRDAIERHRNEYLLVYKGVSFLVAGETLDRTACGIRRTSIDETATERQREAKQQQTADPSADRSEPAAPICVKDEELIQRLISTPAQRMFITGEGGMGKTEYTRLIAFRLAEQLQLDPCAAVPLRLELKSAGRRNSVTDLFQNALAPGDTYQWAMPLASKGRIVFILDGLDEVSYKRDEFDAHLRALISDYPQCSFVLAGRPESLLDLAHHFSDSGSPGSAVHILQPLETSDIEGYVCGLFEAQARKKAKKTEFRLGVDAKCLAAELIGQIRRNRATLFPIIQQPLILALSCDWFWRSRTDGDGAELPDNPAALVEEAVSQILERRTMRLLDKRRLETHAALEALSALAAFTLLRDPEQVSLSLNKSKAEKALSENPPKGNVEASASLLAALAPGSGLLSFDGHAYTFTNRVIAEYLAACWIARHGYPGWPYDPRKRGINENSPDPLKQPYTCPSAKVADEEGRSEKNEAAWPQHSILDFLGDNVWSNNRMGILQALFFELGRDERGSRLLMRFVGWLDVFIRSLGSPVDDDLDVTSTLVDRGFRVFQAMHGAAAGEHHDEISRLATQTQWLAAAAWWDHASGGAWIGRLPAPCRRAYFKPAADALQKASVDPEKNWRAIRYLAPAIATHFAGDAQLKQQALQALSDALQKASVDPEKNWRAIRDLAPAIATHFAGDAQLKQQARQALSDALQKASVDPEKNWRAIRDLAPAIATHFAGDAQLKQQALQALSDALQKASVDPEKNWIAIGDLAPAIATHFAGDAQLKQQARQALSDALQKASVDPEKNWRAIRDLAPAIATHFAGDAQLKQQALQALSDALQKASVDPEKNWEAIRDLAPAIATHFAGDAQLKQQALQALSDALQKASVDPEKNWRAISDLAPAIATHFAGDAQLKQQARQALSDALQKASVDPEKNWRAIRDLAPAIATHFAGDAQLKQQARQALSDALQKASVDPEKNWRAIRDLAPAIATHFAGDAQLKQQARQALSDALQKASVDPEKNWRAIRYLAPAIATHFAGDAQLKQQALQALSDALQKASVDPEKNWIAIGDLAPAIATHFAGDAQLKQQALQALSDALQKASVDPEKNWIAIGDLAPAIATHFAGDAQLKQQARQALSDALQKASVDPEKNWLAISYLAPAIATHFAGDAQLKQQALQALSDALQKASVDPEKNWRAIRDLAPAIATHFAGELVLASRLAALDTAYLHNKAWNIFIVLVCDKPSSGEKSMLETYAGLHGERWGLDSVEPIIRLVDKPNNPDKAAEEVPRVILVAPREKIRRGLPGELLPTEVDETTNTVIFDTDDLNQLAMELKERADLKPHAQANRQREMSTYLAMVLAVDAKGIANVLRASMDEKSGLERVWAAMKRLQQWHPFPKKGTLGKIDHDLAYPAEIGLGFSQRTEEALKSLFDRLGVKRRGQRTSIKNAGVTPRSVDDRRGDRNHRQGGGDE